LVALREVTGGEGRHPEEGLMENANRSGGRKHFTKNRRRPGKSAPSAYDQHGLVGDRPGSQSDRRRGGPELVANAKRAALAMFPDKELASISSTNLACNA